MIGISSQAPCDFGLPRDAGLLSQAIPPGHSQRQARFTTIPSQRARGIADTGLAAGVRPSSVRS
jgi:hypothetical protein